MSVWYYFDFKCIMLSFKNIIIAGLSVLASIGSVNAQSVSSLDVDNIGIEVKADDNREYSFTDKKSGFWYGRTHQDKPIDWFAGWNIAKQRVLSDFVITLDGNPLQRSKATKVVVTPANIQWQWDWSATNGDACQSKNVKVTLSMVDKAEIIVINLECEEPCKSDISLLFPDGADKGKVHSTKCDNNFILTYGTKEQSDSLVALYKDHGRGLFAERKARMNDLLQVSNPTKTNLPELDKALGWLTLTMDGLITEQQGKGIYAGLPWFNEYWGRDMFIAMPGATLVTGQFEYTKDILNDFAKFQDRDETSVTCGRIPNRANLEGILYNTADGTPRYVMEAEELLKYSGDASFLKDIYPSIVLSIDQSLKKSTDKRGYLMHEDADTWMDVKRNGIPGSPRGNRANDIQYLWYCQLMSGANLARLMNDPQHAEAWQKAAQKLVGNFENDFCNKKKVLIYDHLNADGSADMQFRPNQLFCLDLVKDQTFNQKVTRRCWEELVYPWGMASLAQWDKDFHPQHENWHWYHKDDAYHNGTVWLWNNGIAMQRMIEYGQQEEAWRLFKNMNHQALVEGAVGSLSENADAHPRSLYKDVETVGTSPKGAVKVNTPSGEVGLSGTFLQAWSNSEQLRVWYQYFLGIRPDLLNNTITIEPRLPSEVTDVETSVLLGRGKLHYSYHNGKVSIRLDGVKGFNGEDPQLDIIEHTADDIRTAQQNPIFKGIDFCKPKPQARNAVFGEYHGKALTY